MNPLPLWLQAIVKLGPTSAIACFLVWFVTSEVPKNTQQTQVHSAAILELQEQTRQLKELQSATYRMLQRVCATMAKTNDERNTCFDK